MKRTNGLPAHALATQAMRNALDCARPLPEEKIAPLKLLLERVRASKEQLGGLDFQKAQLEAQMQNVRAQLARDSSELEQLVRAEASAQGLDGQAGWVFDMGKLSFVRPG